MKPRSDANPGGFDYAGQIDVLAEPRLALPGGAVLELDASYAATEAAHMTTVYSRDLGALFTGDLAYQGVHLWLGVGVTQEAAREWQATLARLESTWAPQRPTVYPGHGPATDTSVFGSSATQRSWRTSITATHRRRSRGSSSRTTASASPTPTSGPSRL